MSWSFSANGKPEEVLAAIDNSPMNSWTGQSREEWDDAKPALKTLVQANVGREISLSAHGHATITDGTKTYAQCDVTLKGA